MTDTPIRIGNASGFYGDRASAVREMLTDGDLDVLTGDYLAELTMLILALDRLKDESRGYAKTFLRQMEDCLGLARDRGVRIVVNAGGLNPAGLAAAVRDLASRLGVEAVVAHVEGDDLLPRAAELGFGAPLAANAYLGAWGIVEALDRGADIVVTGRVTDASLVVGPAAHHFGWARDDYDALAGAVAAGHVVECGPQATGGNYSFFTELADAARPGFPLAEVHADGSSVITKHPGTGGAVTVDTVTAQLLYEVGGARYLGPDVTTRFDTIAVTGDGPDRVRLDGTRGEPPPPTLKVGFNTLGGYRNEVVFVLTGLDIDAKAELVKKQMAASVPADARWTLARTDHADAATEQEASALLHCVVRSSDAKAVGRAFSSAAIELALASYPGFNVTAPPAEASPYGVFTAAYVPADQVDHVTVLADGTRVPIAPTAGAQNPTPDAEPDRSTAAGDGPTGRRPLVSIAPADEAREAVAVDEPGPDLPPPPAADGPTRRLPLGTVAGARSGDKGGAANIGVWVRSDAAWPWLAHTLTVDELRRLLPETADLPVTRHVFPNLRALNFVVDGILGEGVSSQARFDPQAKALGEWLRSRHVDIPEALL